MTSIALNQDSTGRFNISYENGALKREADELSCAKHNLFCFDRLNKNLTKNPKLRRGDLGSFLEGRDLYSKSWLYYLEGSITLESMTKIAEEFNSACNRDFQAGIIKNKVSLKSITKLDKNTINFTINIGSSSTDYTINLK